MNNNRSILWDAVGTILFGAIFLWSIIRFTEKSGINFDLVNPISDMFQDFEMTDLVFSKIRENPDVDDRIVLVNIGDLSRAEIAEEINIISQYKPKVIGIDARFFDKLESDIGDSTENAMYAQSDSLLADAFKKAGNVVLGCELAENQGGWIDSIQYALPIFDTVTSPAYVDMIAEGLSEFKTARNHFLRQKLKDSTYMLSFAARIAQMYKPDCINKIVERNKDTEIINYYGNINCVSLNGTPNSKITFGALDVVDVFAPDSIYPKENLKDKIIIMGFMGSNFQTYSTVDRFFTPLNDKYVGRADQDMYGVIVHANIVAMILNENYINEMSETWTFIMNILIIFLNIILFQYLYSKLELFWDGATLLITLAQALLFITIIVYIFSKYNYKLDFGLATLALFLMPNIIELYYGLVKATIIKTVERYNRWKKVRKTIVKPEEE
jgi:CHASE2 domain-containing sensor protein